MSKKILVVDDDMDIREVIKISLLQDGFEVIEASNGEDAIELAIKDKPDLITMDIMMPGVDGFEASKAIKGNPVTKHIPIIILSVLSQDKKNFIQGISDYISKPFKPDELVEKIKKILAYTGKEASKNILLVDDDQNVLDIIALSLEDKGFTLVCAKDGIDALEKLKIFIPNAIVTDIQMPRMDGFELIKQIKKEPRFNSIPIIVLTGTYISNEEIKYGLSLGAIKYLTKPFDITSLVKEIEEILCKK